MKVGRGGEGLRGRGGGGGGVGWVGGGSTSRMHLTSRVRSSAVARAPTHPRQHAPASPSRSARWRSVEGWACAPPPPSTPPRPPTPSHPPTPPITETRVASNVARRGGSSEGGGGGGGVRGGVEQVVGGCLIAGGWAVEVWGVGAGGVGVRGVGVGGVVTWGSSTGDGVALGDADFEREKRRRQLVA